jgi:hypothetical protein
MSYYVANLGAVRTQYYVPLYTHYEITSLVSDSIMIYMCNGVVYLGANSAPVLYFTLFL